MERLTLNKKHYFQVNNWLFEVKQISAIRTDEYGKPYDAATLITISNGRAAIERMISKDKLSHSDKSDIETALNSIGFDRNNTDWERFSVDGTKRIKNK